MYYSLPAGDLGSINHAEKFSMTGIVSSANHQRPGQRIVFEDGDRPRMESTARPPALSLFLSFLSSPFSWGANGCGVFTLAAPVECGRPYNFRAYYHRTIIIKIEPEILCVLVRWNSQWQNGPFRLSPAQLLTFAGSRARASAQILSAGSIGVQCMVI
jgi:hypothetical protein